MSAENILITKNSIPSEVEFYAPKATGIEKFQFFYTRDFLYHGRWFPVWTNFDIQIIEIAVGSSPLAIIEHGWDRNRERGRLLFDSMDKNFERFGVIDLIESKKRPWYVQIFHKILQDPNTVGLWKLTPAFRKYFLEGDGIERGSWWYIYVLRRPMPPDEFISLLEDYIYKYVRTEGGLFDPNKPLPDNIVVTPDVESFIFKDFSSARLCVSTSNTLIAQKIAEFSMQSGITIQHKIGDIDLSAIDHINTWGRFTIRKR